MYDNKIRLAVITVVIALIILALGIGGMLNIAVFKKNYTESLAGGYDVAALAAKRNIEYSIRYGKMITRYIGMEEQLQEIKRNLPDAEKVCIVQPDGKILYELTGEVKNAKLSPELIGKVDFRQNRNHDSSLIVFSESSYHVFIPIRNPAAEWIASIDIVIPESVVATQVDAYSWMIFQATVVIAIVSLNFLVFILFAIPILDKNGQVRRMLLIFVAAIIFVMAQFAYRTANTNTFQQAYLAMAKENMNILMHTIGDDIISVVNKGVLFERLVGLDSYFDKVIAGSPEVAGIKLVDGQNTVLYQSQNKAEANPEYRYSRDLVTDKRGTAGTLEIELSKDFFKSKTQNIVTISLAITGCFFVVLAIFYRFLPDIKQKVVQRIKQTVYQQRQRSEVK